MTDELELLLREEQEEPETVSELLFVKAAGTAAAEKSRKETDTVEDIPQSGGGALTDSLLSMADAGDPEGEAALAVRKKSIQLQAEEGLQTVPWADAGLQAAARGDAGLQAVTGADEGLQTVTRAESNAQALYQTLTRARQAARGGMRAGAGSGRMPLTKEPEQSSGPDRDILRLDRAFQRDARRYDGGFTWQ